MSTTAFASAASPLSNDGADHTGATVVPLFANTTAAPLPTGEALCQLREEQALYTSDLPTSPYACGIY